MIFCLPVLRALLLPRLLPQFVRQRWCGTRRSAQYGDMAAGRLPRYRADTRYSAGRVSCYLRSGRHGACLPTWARLPTYAGPAVAPYTLPVFAYFNCAKRHLRARCRRTRCLRANFALPANAALRGRNSQAHRAGVTILPATRRACSNAGRRLLSPLTSGHRYSSGLRQQNARRTWLALPRMAAARGGRVALCLSGILLVALRLRRALRSVSRCKTCVAFAGRRTGMFHGMARGVPAACLTARRRDALPFLQLCYTCCAFTTCLHLPDEPALWTACFAWHAVRVSVENRAHLRVGAWPGTCVCGATFCLFSMC